MDQENAEQKKEPKRESNFSLLDSAKVLKTINRLQRRISERFPGSGLASVCAELESVCAHSSEQIEWIGRPHWPLRILRYSLVLTIIAGLVAAVVGIKFGNLGEMDASDWIQTLEAGINDVVMIGLALFFVWTLESRVKRRRALKALHQLRSIAHVIDMHQLTKDPDRISGTHTKTDSSPNETMNAFQLRRYLDYCSEMLSLTSKVAALHLQNLDEPTVVGAVEEIEVLTTGLSRKIWQKIDFFKTA